MRKYDKNKIMAEACQKIEELIAIEHPDKGITVRYIKMGTEEYAEFSDFEKSYHHLHLGEEYIIIANPETNLYFVDVTYDSMLTAVYEAMKLIQNKF